MAFSGRNNLPVVRWKLPESHIQYLHNFNNKETSDILQEIDDHVLYKFFVQSVMSFTTSLCNLLLNISPIISTRLLVLLMDHQFGITW